MPVGYLVSVGLVAVGMWCALVAPPVAFRLGVLFAELPFLALYLLVGSTVLAFAEGDLTGVAGWIGVGLAVVTAGGLGVVVRRAARGRTGIPWARILFTPFAVRRRGVERRADIRYGDAGRRQLLDVYRPRVPNGRVLVYWHGGGYFSGRKNREARLLLYRLAARGWVCVSANYRLRPEANLDDHLADARSVIAWVRKHGPSYGADPAKLVLAGSSAGGHLASMVALTDPGVAAVVSLYGYYGNYYGTADGPAAHLHPDAPPFFLAHGDRDTYVPVEQARHFAERLRQTSRNPVVYLELPGGHHSFDLFHSIRFDTVVQAASEFLDAQNTGEECDRPPLATSVTMAGGGSVGLINTASASAHTMSVPWPRQPVLCAMTDTRTRVMARQSSRPPTELKVQMILANKAFCSAGTS